MAQTHRVLCTTMLGLVPKVMNFHRVVDVANDSQHQVQRFGTASGYPLRSDYPLLSVQLVLMSSLR